MTDLAIAAESDSKRDAFFDSYGFRILKALRRIMHASDSHSRKLNEQFHITAPQMLCLYSLVKDGIETQSELVKHIDLGASTINGIVDRLEEKGLVRRERSQQDRRRVLLQVSEKGLSLTRSASALLQANFSQALRALPELEQATIALSLERVVELMTH